MAEIEKLFVLTGVLEAVMASGKDGVCLEMWSFACQYRLESMLPKLETMLLRSSTAWSGDPDLEKAGQVISGMSSRGLQCAAISLLSMLKQAKRDHASEVSGLKKTVRTYRKW